MIKKASNEEVISEYIQSSIELKEKVLKTQVKIINKVIQEIVRAYKNERKVFWFGNGGSAADAQHLACELVSKFFNDRRALASIALTTNTSELTAIANDYNFNKIFARQVEALVRQGDIVIGLSTSGNSLNVIEGLKTAKQIGAITVGLTGETGGKLKDYTDYLIAVPSKVTPHIQESHIMIGHVICYLVERELFGE
jgi:D-sedoheptulose 7-phosphate isomerase